MTRTERYCSVGRYAPGCMCVTVQSEKRFEAWLMLVLCFCRDADMSVVRVSRTPGRDEAGWTLGHFRRHFRKRGVYISWLRGRRAGQAAIGRRRWAFAMQIDKRNKHNTGMRNVRFPFRRAFPDTGSASAERCFLQNDGYTASPLKKCSLGGREDSRQRYSQFFALK